MTFSYTSQSELHVLRHPTSFETLRFHTHLNQNYTFCDIRRASTHFFIHLSITIALFAHPTSFEHDFFHTPLIYNCTFCDIRRASTHDIFIHHSIRNILFCDIRRASTHDCFIHLSIRIPLFATSVELQNMMFSYTSQS